MIIIEYLRVMEVYIHTVQEVHGVFKVQEYIEYIVQAVQAIHGVQVVL